MAKSARQNALPFRVPLPWNQSKRVLGGGRLSCFRLAASSSHVSPRAANRSLMWPSARFRRSANVPGLSSADTQKSLKNCRTTSRRRSISCLLGEALYLVALGPDHNAIGDRLFLCHGIHS